MHMVAVTVHKKEKLHDHATGSNKKNTGKGVEIGKISAFKPELLSIVK